MLNIEQILAKPVDINPLTIYKYGRVESRIHLLFVKSFPCSIHQHGEHCNGQGSPIDPDHLMLQGGRGTSFKESDEWTLPLCRIHHNEKTICGNEREFWQRWDMSYEEAEEICISKALLSPAPVIVERMIMNLQARGFSNPEILNMRLPVWL